MLLVLASRSPQRVLLLHDAGYDFVAEPADVDESVFPDDLSPAKVAEHLALAKADKIAASRVHDLILGADTIVSLAGQMLGKPRDPEHAREMLSQLSGSTHEVITAIALIAPGLGVRMVDHVISEVSMRTLSPREIDVYVRSGAWQGKAGGYGMQDADPFVTTISGSVSNVIGLPIERTRELLRPFVDAGHL